MKSSLTLWLQDENAEMRAACLEGLGHLGEMARWDAVCSDRCIATLV